MPQGHRPGPADPCSTQKGIGTRRVRPRFELVLESAYCRSNGGFDFERWTYRGISHTLSEDVTTTPQLFQPLAIANQDMRIGVAIRPGIEVVARNVTLRYIPLQPPAVLRSSM